MSFDDGLILGLSLGAGTSAMDVPDPDYPLWQSLPEPADNGSVFLVRVTDTTQQVQVTFNYASTEVEYSVAVDWGDGSQTVIENESVFNHPKHVYSNAGDYVITVTSSNLENFRAWFVYCYYADYNNQYANYWIMAKYGENVLLEKAYPNGFYNFSGEEKLKYLKISSQTEITARFFSGCYALREIVYGKIIENIPDYTFQNCYALQLDWDLSQLNSIGAYAFNNNYALTKLDLPVCEQVGNNAFQNCTALQSVALASCGTIGDSAFTDCRNLQKVSAPSCTAVGSSGFAYNYNLLSAQFADNCTFGNNAFNQCYSLNFTT